MTFFRHSPKAFLHFPKNLIYLPKILMTFFFSHRPFSCFNVAFFLRGANSVADIEKGGQNPYISPNSQYYHYSFFPRRGGQTPLPTSMGAMAGFPPQTDEQRTSPSPHSVNGDGCFTFT